MVEEDHVLQVEQLCVAADRAACRKAPALEYASENDVAEQQAARRVAKAAALDLARLHLAHVVEQSTGDDEVRIRIIVRAMPLAIEVTSKR
jgi:hypothetical protein